MLGWASVRKLLLSARQSQQLGCVGERGYHSLTLSYFAYNKRVGVRKAWSACQTNTSTSNTLAPTNTIHSSHSLYHMKFDWILGQLMRRFCNLLIRRLTLQDQLRICFNNCSSIKHLNLSKRVEFHVNGVNMTHVRFMAR